MKNIIILSLLAFLMGCNTQPKVITKEIYRVPNPPKVLFNCPQIQKSEIPDPATATNQEISDFIVKMYRNLKTCGTNINKLEKWFTEAQFVLETNDREQIITFFNKSKNMVR